MDERPPLASAPSSSLLHFAPSATGHVPVHYSSAMAMTRGSVERNDTEQHVMSIVNIADFITKPAGHPRIDVPQLTHGRELRIDERHITAAAAGFLAIIGRDCGLTLLFDKKLGCWPWWNSSRIDH